jgi:GTP cyclohydrolase IA
MENSMQKLITSLLKEIGEDTFREGLIKTPYRVEKTLTELTSGYKTDLQTVLNEAIYNEKSDNMVVVTDIEFYSLCEHHLLPFFGKAHVAYIPNGKIIGLSKIPRIIEMYSKRLQVQERLTHQVAIAIQEALVPQGVGVVLEAKHLCMMMRGVKKQNSFVVTSSMHGSFRRNLATREEFLKFIPKN